MPVLTGKYSYNCLTGRIVLVDRDNVYQATLKKEKKRLKHLKGDYPSSTVPLDDSDFISYF